MSDVSGVPSTPAESPATTAVLEGDFSTYQRETNRSEAPASSSPISDVRPAAPSPAPPADGQAASTEALSKPTSEPAPAKKNAESRKAELESEIQATLKRRADVREELAREEGRLAALKASASPDAKPAASSPATDAEPDPNDLTKYPEGQFDRKFLKDQARWEARQEFQSAQQAAREQWEARQRDEARVTRARTFADRIAAAESADSTFTTTLTPQVLALKPSDEAARMGEPVTAAHALADEFLTAEDGPRLMRHFSEHPDELARVTRLLPRDFFGALALLRHQWSQPAAAAPVTTKTPPPPPTLGSRPAPLPDDVQSAVADGDFRRFFKAANSRELAARK